MPQSRFNLTPEEPLSDREVRAVIALWTKEQAERERLLLQSRLRDVAEGLEISEDEAVRLLVQVRAADSRRLPRRLPATLHAFVQKTENAAADVLTWLLPVFAIWLVLFAIFYASDTGKYMASSLPLVTILAVLFFAAEKLSREKL